MHFPIMRGNVSDTSVHSVVMSMKFQEEVHLEGSSVLGEFQNES